MYTEIIKIIEGGLKKDTKKVYSYSKLLASKLSESGEKKMANAILEVINQKMANTVALDELMATPVDHDSRMSMADIYVPGGKDETSSIVLPALIENKINSFINVIKHQKDLTGHGLRTANTLLLYGKPGVGKSRIAQYISGRTGLPLVVARLDAIVSSLLGNTAKNVRKIFEFADSKPCILFLDEFDAIAKARDDQYELGELKRVINSLLQNIDAFSENNILIAATNHHDLLDKAIWRRFNTIIEVAPPAEEEISRLIQLFLGKYKTDFASDRKKIDRISKLLSGKTPADIRGVIEKAITQSILSGEDTLDFEDVLIQIFDFDRHGEYKMDDVIKFLVDNGVAKTQVAEKLEISIRKVREKI